ncbi:putative bifunctional diguanylate cyclase/phosphodiesterase [Sphingomonas sanxanigenens]|uniref:Diguanylate cyclase n=1 Tax=Sphingomonas sanxanigenens DSM 19645 = NX02 TaxID=1123269 RepID=W0AJM8_9SPHN|nr:bifunctional diguanylate cyclase/phosphodiesterase [Sphingomonas sanxanigenens]AHE57351.1 hypothetical protein NX02_28910 [Sphingomonas sanxanigenens DSM 19645 = NX02]
MPSAPEGIEAWLEALPIPAAVVELTDGRIAEATSNALFRNVTGRGRGSLFDPARLGDRALAFLASSDPISQFGWLDDQGVDRRHYRVRFARLADGRAAGVPCALVSLVDRTVEAETAIHRRGDMMRDPLTGLLNRAGFAEAVSLLQREDRAGELAVLVVDLSRFSRINVCMGADVGDALIVTVGRRLRGALRVYDQLGRIGGDEFAILLHLIDGPGDALHVARRIEEILAEPVGLSDFEIRVDCAIGVAISTESDGEDEDIVRHAQFALRRAKESGRIEIYRNRAFTEARRRFSIETELRRAIENDKLSLAFQPIVSLGEDRLVGFEALARWRTEAGEEIAPGDFIPVAEESGLIIPLGRWALDAAGRMLARWEAETGQVLPLSLSVNLSAIQLIRDDVPRQLEDVLHRHGLGGHRFTLELTESAIINDPDRAARVMGALKDLDARLAMDDFGTGYSNLAMLQSLPVDILKIDRSFVTTMLADRDKVAIVRAVLSLAHALGMETTAEGVETIELSQTLAALGCTYGQGFHYAPPLDAATALAFWSRWQP